MVIQDAIGIVKGSRHRRAAVLFSGGLDSLVGAIDMLEAGSRLLLVSHYDFGQLASLQQGLAAALTAHYGPERVQHLAIRVQFPEAPELSLRSRSLLFLALGLSSVLKLERWPRHLAILVLIASAGLGVLRLKNVGLKDYAAYQPVYAALAAIVATRGV